MTGAWLGPSSKTRGRSSSFRVGRALAAEDVEVGLAFDGDAELVFEAVVWFDVIAVLVLDALLVADDEGELCSDIVVELVLGDDEAVGRGELELAELVVPDERVPDERVPEALEELAVLGRLMVPGDTTVVDEWVASDEIVVLEKLVMDGGLVIVGELVVSPLEWDDDTVGWASDDVGPGP